MTRTAAQDSVVRLSMAMMAADTRASLTPAQREWIIDRLQHQTALSDAERTGLREPLLTYIAAYHPRIVEIVARQFTGEGETEGPHHTGRPFDHYGVVKEPMYE